ncbi:Ltp family lipoprotein [Nocardioides sp. SR21]|uniref:Ltp family lipoprotein n=1 Tax=Nocardioides sp. SR21 TaxID=2919501 RepID=UPI001FAA76C9|nr:Ltp family lipoprotein [Nocardioides sp. SR21]
MRTTIKAALAATLLTSTVLGGVALAPAANATTGPQRQAIGTAYDYLDFTHFSKAGLSDQLQYEGFSRSVSNYAVNHIKVSWNNQAVGSAKDYLRYSHFSCSGLIDQLEYEKFTAAQARYGAHHTRAC